MASKDVAVRAEGPMAPNQAQIPSVANLNINKSSRVQIGPKFVTVTQNVQNTEMVKGKCLCFDLISGQSYGGLRCAVAVFVCWSLIVATALSVYFIYIVLPNQRTRLDLELSLPKYLWDVAKNSSRTERVLCAVALVAVIVCVTLIVYFTTRTTDTDDTVDTPPHEWNITRQMWLAQPYNHSERTTVYDPLFLVIVQHSVSNECRRFVTCAAELRNLQSYFIHSLNYDIPYNFLIGNDGRVYEGRGWGVVGAHTFTYNSCSLGLGFIGDYREEITPFTRVTEAQLNRTHMLLEEGVRLGYLRSDYQVVGAKDLQVTASPGSNLYNALRQWPNYDHENRFRGLSCKQIYEKYRNVHL